MPTVTARVEEHCAASPERLYDAWLNATAVRAWMAESLRGWGLPGEMKRLEIDARIGGRFFFSDQRGHTVAEHWGVYHQLDRPSVIAFTWITDASEEANPSQVRIVFEAHGTGTRVTLTHEMDAAWADYLERTEKGWRGMIRAINNLLTAKR
jgi:uncharacterized protein YndB with AHSA1/START domain